MPIYEYRCENGHSFEVLHGMSDDPVATCQECDAPVQRVFHPVAVHFKGSGFYTTDYARSKTKPGSEGGEKSGGEKSSGEKGGGEKSGGSSSGEKKSESKSESKKDSTTSAAS